MLVDTHCHLDAAEFDADRAEIIEAAAAAGVRGFVVPAIDRASFARVEALCRATPGGSAAYGIHPLCVSQARPADLAVLEAQLASGNAVAVGEIGLDGFVTDLPLELQESYFVAQLEIARRLALPVVLHVRRAVDLVLKHLRRIEVPGGIAHAFNGSRQQADQFQAMGFALGFGGTLSFEGSRRIRSLAATLPESAIVLETDAPDIAPAWRRGGRSEPAFVARYATILAELRGVGAAEVAAFTTANARRVLPRMDSARQALGGG
jgi:TatD DNase family protein